MISYEVVYSKKPLMMTSYLLCTSKIHAIDKELHTEEVILHTYKDHFDPQSIIMLFFIYLHTLEWKKNEGISA